MFYLKAEDGQKLKELWPADHIWRCEDTLYCAPCGLGFMVIFTTNNNRHCYCSVHCYYSSHKTSQSRLLKLYVQCKSIISWNKFYDVDEKQRSGFRDNFECTQKISVCVANKPIMMPFPMNITILLQYFNYITAANQPFLPCWRPKYSYVWHKNYLSWRHIQWTLHNTSVLLINPTCQGDAQTGALG